MVRAAALLVLLLLAVVPATAGAASERVPAKWAKQHRLGKAAAKKDVDRDGLGTWAEWRSRTNPRKADSDRDGRPDGKEDRDRDGLANGFELAAGTDPGSADSDRDRRRDGREDADRDGLDHAAEQKYGYAPRRRDSDGDGVRDGDENPGVVRAVEGRRVTIVLARGGTLVATLAEEGDVACDLALEELAPGGGDGLGGEEAITGDEEISEAPESEEGEEADEDFADGPDWDVAEASAAAPDDGDGLEEPADGGCATSLRPGALVHAATVVPGPAGLELTAIELLTTG